jgi:hypothetical protein
MRFVILTALLAFMDNSPLRANPIFNFTLGSGVHVGDPVYDGFVAAGERWSALFTDNVTINVFIDSEPLGAGVLGQTGNALYYESYSGLKTALAGDATSATDATAVAHLQPGNLTFAANHTSDCGNCAPVYLDHNGNFNNQNVVVSGSEAKALGLLAPTNATLDGSITFSSTFNFDFNPLDGIAANAYDFTGVATHEIGHLLGFTSSVDDYDICGANPSQCGGVLGEANYAPTVLDLFRYSTDSGFGTLMDMSVDTRARYFSIDGGATLGAMFSDGANFGDGSQASHWKDNLGLGVMDPTASQGELMAITQNDIQALDAIGWNVAAPEPYSLWLGAIGLGMLALVGLGRLMPGQLD